MTLRPAICFWCNSWRRWWACNSRALTVGRALGTAFLRHFSERRVLRAGYAVGAAGIWLMLWGPALPGVIGRGVVNGFRFSTLFSITLPPAFQRLCVFPPKNCAVTFFPASGGAGGRSWGW